MLRYLSYEPLILRSCVIVSIWKTNSFNMPMPFITLRVKQTQGKRKEADIQTASKHFPCVWNIDNII